MHYVVIELHCLLIGPRQFCTKLEKAPICCSSDILTERVYEIRVLRYCSLQNSKRYQLYVNNVSKLQANNNNLYVNSKWGSDAKTLRTATFALIHSAAVLLSIVLLSDAATLASTLALLTSPYTILLRLVTGCLRPTPIDNIFVLADITPTELRRKRAILSLTRRAMNPEHLLQNSRLHTFIPYTDSSPPRMTLPRPSWVRLWIAC